MFIHPWIKVEKMTNSEAPNNIQPKKKLHIPITKSYKHQNSPSNPPTPPKQKEKKENQHKNKIVPAACPYPDHTASKKGESLKIRTSLHNHKKLQTTKSFIQNHYFFKKEKEKRKNNKRYIKKKRPPPSMHRSECEKMTIQEAPNSSYS